MNARDVIQEHFGYESAGLVGDDALLLLRRRPARQRGRIGWAGAAGLALALLAIGSTVAMVGWQETAAEPHAQQPQAELLAAEARGEQRAMEQLGKTAYAAYRQGQRDALEAARGTPEGLALAQACLQMKVVRP